MDDLPDVMNFPPGISEVSHQFILKSKWTFGPNLKTFPKDIPEISGS